MKPAWDKLMENWNTAENLETTLVADVDCTINESQHICDEAGVKGFPTIKWGDPSNLEDYNGERDYESLMEFAEENLIPQCSPVNLDICDEITKREISDYQAMSLADLEEKVKEKKKLIKDAEELFETEVEKLEATYEELEKTKDDTINEVKKSDFGLMNAILSVAKKAALKAAPVEEL